MRSRSALLLAATTSAATLAGLSLTAPADATHAWGSYHWARTANPFTLTVGNNVTSGWDAALDTSVTDWGASSVMNLVEGTGGTTARKCRAVAGTVQVCNAAYGSNGWLGLATITITGGTHITSGTAKMNDSYFSTSKYNNPNEKLHVMCQEVGHTFGLGHTSEDGSSQNTCMDYFSNTGANAGSTTSTHPNSHDYAMLESVYAHLDSTSTVGATTASTPSVGEDRATWGREVHRAADGSHSLFVRDLGRGSLVVTHVTWALDRQAAGRARHGE
ncbi:MAG TPA: hypothetical protein VM097_03705 [Mycobacteriales bacterium]|nr:hypothetical protein [Mycobacteriales bacterium]